MKIKEIIKNKWGWSGAGIVAMYILYQNNFNLCLINFSCSIPVMMFNFGRLQSFVFYGGIIVGFIIGLVAEKIWRKIR